MSNTNPPLTEASTYISTYGQSPRLSTRDDREGSRLSYEVATLQSIEGQKTVNGKLVYFGLSTSGTVILLGKEAGRYVIVDKHSTSFGDCKLDLVMTDGLFNWWEARLHPLVIEISPPKDIEKYIKCY